MQSVLIHDAAGAVGHAALRYARSVGASIYATAGSEEERASLIEKGGLAKDRIFTSTNDSFVVEVLKATGGQGVDLALNSLPGSEVLQATGKCIADFGKLVNIGPVDGLLDMTFLLDSGKSYTAVSLAALMAKKQSVIKRYDFLLSRRQSQLLSWY